MMTRFACIAVILLSMIVSGCVPQLVDEIFMQKDDVSLVARGAVVMNYDGVSCQMAYNAKRHEFRVMDDDMAHYFVLKCDADPSDVDQELTADLKYTTLTDVKIESGLLFRIVKTEPSTGKFWLWCSSKKIGLVVRKI